MVAKRFCALAQAALERVKKNNACVATILFQLVSFGSKLVVQAVFVFDLSEVLFIVKMMLISILKVL